MKLFLQVSPKISLTIEMEAAVLPTPGGPEKSRCGRLRVLTYDLSRLTISSWPTMSSSFSGRYFSIQISSLISIPQLMVQAVRI